MNRFRSLIGLFMVVALFGLMGCKNQPCSKVKPYSDVAAVGLATALQCSGVEYMKADFIKAMQDKGMCKADQPLNGPIAMIVCPIVVPLAISALVSQTKPEWGCTGAATEAALTSVCMALPF